MKKSIKKAKDTRPLPMGKKTRRAFTAYVCLVLMVFMVSTMSVTAFAATNDPLTVIDNLSTFIFGLIRAVGIILLGWGIVQIGISLKSHDPSQRANGFLTLAGMCEQTQRLAAVDQGCFCVPDQLFRYSLYDYGLP